ncbi:hypothetical protein IMW82_00850 [Rhodanobacter sp. B2A1Ga4]|nr:hypothetical protein [Rhodanobacter sp. B2A1Ga4]MBQ4853229.1 hypothetical protein [Rhodanobacter sp. B2A1Ga4]
MRAGDLDAYRNDDLIVGVRWLGTLDTASRPECRIRDGLIYSKAPSHAPINHEVPWLGGPGHIHARCRCIGLPVMRTWRELGIDLPELLPGTRASMTGPVSAALTYGEWIAAQADEIQRKALGDERATLMRVGGLAFYQLYDASGTYLSIDRLRTLFPVAFAICGMR